MLLRHQNEMHKVCIEIKINEPKNLNMEKYRKKKESTDARIKRKTLFTTFTINRNIKKYLFAIYCKVS